MSEAGIARIKPNWSWPIATRAVIRQPSQVMPVRLGKVGSS